VQRAEMYLAGVSVRRVEDITEALWGTRVSPSTVSEIENPRACRACARRAKGSDGIIHERETFLRPDRLVLEINHRFRALSSFVLHDDMDRGLPVVTRRI
jgi:hypothetical protein